MRYLSLIGLSLFLWSCSNGEHFNRGYVISKSQIESEAEPASPEEPDLH